MKLTLIVLSGLLSLPVIADDFVCTLTVGSEVPVSRSEAQYHDYRVERFSAHGWTCEGELSQDVTSATLRNHFWGEETGTAVRSAATARMENPMAIDMPTFLASCVCGPQ